MLKNKIFTIMFNKKTGGIQEIKLNGDDSNMNFVKKDYSLNTIMLTRRIDKNMPANIPTISFEEDELHAKAVWKTDSLRVEAQYTFTKEGNLKISNRFKNESNVEMFLERGKLGILMPFSDEYPGAEECMTNRCHTHIWCGLSGASYVCCLKMGHDKHNIGLVVTRGGFESYSQYGTKSNDRGWFLIHPDVQMIKENDEYILEYEIFTCAGKEDFINKCDRYEKFMNIKSKTFSVFQGENIEFEIPCKNSKDVLIEEYHDNMKVNTYNTDCKNMYFLHETQKKTSDSKCERLKFVCQTDNAGEYKFLIKTKNVNTLAVFQVLPNLNETLVKRVKYITEYQQYSQEGSHLDGAYMVYNTREKVLIYDKEWPDCNASRERIGMGILVAYFLRHYDNTINKKNMAIKTPHKEKNSEGSIYDKSINFEQIWQSLMKYEEFVRREIYDDKTGRVYDDIKRDESRDRLYNYLWVALFYTEMYKLTRQKKYADDVLKIIRNYYKRGGENHYPNGIFFSDFLELFRGKSEYEEIKMLFLNHADRIMEKGANYPKHEVNYEQTIVAPAVEIMLDAVKYCTEDMKRTYENELKVQMRRLERFDGFAPHYKLNEVAIRYWDAYWFGKSHVFGDTMPHYWSSLSSINYVKMGKEYNMDKYMRKGSEGLKSCLCMFFQDGSASCASVFPYKVNGVNGEFMDEFANDQDFALYYAARFLE